MASTSTNPLEPFHAAVEGMAEAITAARWGTEYDPTDASQGLTEEIWREARAGTKAAYADDAADALGWLFENPVAFLDAYADWRFDG